MEDNKIFVTVVAISVFLIPALMNFIKLMRSFRGKTCLRCKCTSPHYAKFCPRCGYVKEINEYDSATKQGHQINPTTNICIRCNTLYSDLILGGMQRCFKALDPFEGDSTTHSGSALEVIRKGHKIDPRTTLCKNCGEQYSLLLSYTKIPICKTLRARHYPGSNNAGFEVNIRDHQIANEERYHKINE